MPSSIQLRARVTGRRLLVLLTPVLAVAWFAAPAGAAKPPPDTVIDSGPAAVTAGTTATFTFHSTGQGATFTCTIDSAVAAPCTSPVSYPGLAEGGHTFAVVSAVSGQVDPTPATRTWTVDLTAPTMPTNLTATAQTGTSIALTWTAGTDATGVSSNRIVRDGVALASVGAVTSYTDSTVTAGSTHTYAVIAVDAAGNPSPSSSTASATTPAAPAAPDTVIDSAPTSPTRSTSASISFHSTASGASFTCSLDGAKAGSCTSPKTYSGLGDGAHTVSVTSTANGVKDPTPATATWTVDTKAPSVPTNLAATATATSVVLNWTASADTTGVTGYDVFRGGTLLASIGALTTYTDDTAALGHTYSYAVRATDGAGNTSALSTSVLATPSAAFDPHLSRAPYLTDLVALHVNVNFATDQSATTASATYGAVNADGTCTPSTVVAATRTPILVGTVYEYQWKAALTLPSAGSYCYRVALGGTDLLGANSSPVFTTQVQPGSTESFSFDVFGDWGSVDTTGQNQGQADLMQQIAASGARFAISVGDNGYPNGSQINYGDLQQTGSATSAIFGKNFWTVPGQGIPLFAGVGNHGVAGTAHTDISTWTQDLTVSSSGGRYRNDVYCCVNGSAASNYGSEWYAFTAGNVRFYVLDSAWGDTNSGTANPYANDAAAHFAPGTPEYTWLVNDLQTHPTQLKFAFSHFPFYSDNNTQGSDTYLQGIDNLEGILGQHGVQLVFNGHAHIYERNAASAAGMPITYVTGGGGATLEPIGPCHAYDSYGIGWSPTTSTGTSCGAGVAPTSAAQLYHFIKVTVSGTTITVAPTDSTGRVFDQKSYTFKVPTDTYIDSAPQAGTTSTSATFAFHASGTASSYSCQLDTLTATTCTSPITYSGLGQGKHTFTVAATVNKSKDPTPATAQWTVDTTAPTAPTTLTATATSPFTVDLSWSGATDNTGVTDYLITRNGAALDTVTGATGYTDYTALGGTTYHYAVVAQDVAGNASGASPDAAVTTAAPPSPIFADGFESGDLSAWGATNGLTVQTTTVHTGSYAVEGSTTTGAVYAKRTLPATYPDAYVRVAFDVVAQPSQVNLVRLRDTSGASLGYAYIETTGQLGYHNDALGTNTLSELAPSPGWHVLELHRLADATGTSVGAVELWLDGRPVSDLSATSLDVGSAPVGAIQIGETQTNQTYDVAFDDVAFATSRLGVAADTTAPSVPAGLTGAATAPFSAQLSWSAATDDVGVAGYDISRDGAVIASVGAVTTFTDDTTLAGSDHVYLVRSRDASGNVSGWSDPLTVTQPAAATPLFTDGFESGDLSGWTTTSGLAVGSADARSGRYAAEGVASASPAFAKRTLPGTYSDAYARVAFEIKSQGTQLVLLRMRDTPTGVGGYVYLSATGKLAFRSDALAAGTVSGVGVGPGWHVVELHLVVAGASSQTQVWLDGTAVGALSFPSIDLGSAAIGVLQIGDTSGVTADVIFDDAAFSTSRIGLGGDTTAPTAPSNVTATAVDGFTVAVAWAASTDNVGVSGYDVLRNGTKVASLPGDTTSYTDTAVLASTTYTYSVDARDAAGNVSDPGSAGVFTPAAAAPVFADGFESGNLSAWTSSGGLAVGTGDVHAGTYAAEGNTTAGNTYAKKTLPSTYNDAYARVAFEVKSQTSQINLLRMKVSAAGASIGYLYLNTSGRLGLHSDAAGVDTLSTVAPSPGWHSLELHLSISTGTTDVWLDGVEVPALAKPVNLGTAQVGALQIGETQTGRTYDVLFDDAAFSTSRIGVDNSAVAPAV